MILLVQTDDPERARRLLGPIVRTELVRHVRYEELPGGPPCGFRLVAVDPTDAAVLELRDRLGERIRADSSIHRSLRLHLRRDHASPAALFDVAGERLTRVVLPFAGSDSLERPRVLRELRPALNVRLFAREPRVWSGLREDLLARGYRASVELLTDRDVTDPLLRVGGAPDELVDEIRMLTAIRAGSQPELRVDWHDGDSDVFVLLPSEPVEPTIAANLRQDQVGDREMFSIFARLQGARGKRGTRPFVELAPDRLRIGDVELPRRDGAEAVRLGAVPLDAFAGFCIDSQVGHTLAFLAESAWMREPTLLTGTTASGKTHAVAWLAAALRQPHHRIVFEPGIDAAALCGRFVPTDPSAFAERLLEDWHSRRELLQPRTVQALEWAERNGGVTPDVARIVVQCEGGPPFAWADGPVVAAMRHGGFLVLDELANAPTEVTERLNALLEVPPSFALVERDGQRFGAGGKAIHGDLTIVATRNPITDHGRNAMSPALQGRFRAQRIVPEPGEQELEQLALCQIYGEQPELEIHGRSWAPAPSDPNPRLAALRAVQGLRERLTALARFHVGVAQAALGEAEQSLASEVDGPVTRRTFVAVLEFAAACLAAHPSTALDEVFWRANLRYYVQPVHPERRAARLDIMEAAGLARSA